MLIRPATLKDSRKLVNLFCKADNLSKEIALDRTKRWLHSKKNKYILVADTGKKLIGFVGIKKDSDSNEKAKRFVDFNNYFEVTWIAVLQESRKKNMGSLLLAEAEKYSKKFNKLGIWLDCRKKVLPFYKRNGYRLVGKFHKNGVYQYVLVKDLYTL